MTIWYSGLYRKHDYVTGRGSLQYVRPAGKLAPTSHVRVCWGIPQEPLWYSEYSWQTGTYFTCTGLRRNTPRTTMILWVQLANWHLLHMYGFAEEYPKNHYDTVSTAGKLAPTSHVRVCWGVPKEPQWYCELKPYNMVCLSSMIIVWNGELNHYNMVIQITTVTHTCQVSPFRR